MEPAGESHGRMVRSFGAIATSTVILALFGLAREAVVAMSFGASSELDAFLFSFSLAYYVPVILSSTLQGTFIPAFYRAQQRDSNGGEKLSHITLNLLLLALILCGMLLLLLGRPIIAALAPGFDPSNRALAFTLLLSLMPTMILTGMNEQLKTVLNAWKVFGFPALTQILPSATTIAALLIGSRKWGVGAFAFGWNLGLFLQTIALAWSWNRAGGSFSFSFDLRFPEFRNLLRESLPYLFVPITAGTILLVDKFFASLIGPGAISYFNYAEKLFRIPWMMIGGALLTVATPYFSEKAAVMDYDRLRRTISLVLGLAAFLAVPIAAGMIILGKPLSTVIFQRGAFTAEDASSTAIVLVGFMASLLFYALSYILDRALCSLGRAVALMKLAVFTLLIKILLAWMMTRTWGLFGLSLSTAPALFMQTAIMYLILQKDIGHLEFGELALSFGKVAVASGIMSAFLYLAWYDGHIIRNALPSILSGNVFLFAIILLGALAYSFATRIMKSREALALLGMIRNTGSSNRAST